MSNYFQRIDISKLYPAFYSKLQSLVAVCDSLSKNYYAVDISDLEHYVDKTMHSYGLAVDLALNASIEGSEFQLSSSDGINKILLEQAQILDLDKGIHWESNNIVHIQLNIRKNSITLDQLKESFDSDGNVAVWAFLDQHDW